MFTNLIFAAALALPRRRGPRLRRGLPPCPGAQARQPFPRRKKTATTRASWRPLPERRMRGTGVEEKSLPRVIDSASRPTPATTSPWCGDAYTLSERGAELLRLQPHGFEALVPGRLATDVQVAVAGRDDVSPFDGHGYATGPATGPHGLEGEDRVSEVLDAVNGDMEVLVAPGTSHRVPKFDRPPQVLDRPGQGPGSHRQSPAPSLG